MQAPLHASPPRFTAPCVCRFVISIFRNDGPGAKGGWGSFVWYASKMDRNIRFLNKTYVPT